MQLECCHRAGIKHEQVSLTSTPEEVAGAVRSQRHLADKDAAELRVPLPSGLKPPSARREQ